MVGVAPTSLLPTERVNYRYDEVQPALPLWNSSDDLGSTRPFPMGGGGSHPTLSHGDLPLVSDLAVVATVVHIHRPVANTETGEIPVLHIGAGYHQLARLVPMTGVEVRIEEVLGQRASSTPRRQAHQNLELSVGGGWLDFVLDATGIKALEITETPSSAENGAGPAGGTVIPDPPHPFRWTISPSVVLEKGERVVLFLKNVRLPRFKTADFSVPAADAVTVQISFGDQGVIRLGKGESPAAEIRELARQLDALDGSAKAWP